ncbi:hypothetical protein BDR26DRAFT_976809 [Obelidium mucronatum]|nr:hypothetical protein BDR26DRAFT_976809 [Obelidium mucronatum]
MLLGQLSHRLKDLSLWTPFQRAYDISLFNFNNLTGSNYFQHSLLRPLSLLKSKTALERTARNTSILVKKQSFKTGKEIQETLESIKSAKIETLSIEEKMKLENEKRKLEKKRKRVDGLASGDGPDVLVSEREKKAKLESKEEDLNDTEKELTNQEKDEANCVSNALVVGINSVTKALSKGIEGDSTLRMVFVCKGECYCDTFVCTSSDDGIFGWIRCALSGSSTGG